MEQQQTPNLVSQYALRMALQTMKERCQSLQKQIEALQEENQQLRETNNKTMSNVSGTSSTNSYGAAENFQLRQMVNDMQRQKTQLTEHIDIVSKENRKLWSRLSKICKERDDFSSFREDEDCTLTQLNDLNSPRSAAAAAANQNLIRSKTFTQHSPNPNLRHKPSIDTKGGIHTNLQDISLDLESDNISGFQGAGEDFAEPGQADLEFAYMQVADDNEGSLEAKKCLEGLQEMRSVASKQKQELQAALVMLESKFAIQRPCTDCLKKSQKPEMADKSLETDESLNEVKFYNDRQRILSDDNDPVISNNLDAPRLNIVQEKIEADDSDKTCPMCGKIFNSQVTFDAFQQHVEMHFIDDNASLSLDNTPNGWMELSSVGDF